MRLPNPRLEAEITRLALAQDAMLNDFYGGSPATARRLQRRLETQTTALVRKHPRDPRAAALWAYNEKNSVMLEHDDDIMAGIKVDEPGSRKRGGASCMVSGSTRSMPRR